jgi:acetyl-CoA C-acetyltransferase
MEEVVIVSGSRTAIGNFGGGLKDVPVVELGAVVMRDVLKRVGLRPAPDQEMAQSAPDRLKDTGLVDLEKRSYDYDDAFAPVTIDEVIMGHVLQTAQGQNTARQAMIGAGVSKETPAFTINKVCGSGLKAIALGASAIMTGQAEVIIAGGQENMSLVPMALTKARWGYKMELSGTGDIYDLMVFDGLWEIFYGYHMGITAENIAAMYDISRQEQDQLGVLSHNRARKAIKNGIFKAEIAPVVINTRKGEIVFDVDERPMDTDIEKMAKLRPAFKKDGTVTAGNASGINDAAAAVLLMSAAKAKEMGLEPIAKVKSFGAGGVDPAYMGLGPVPAVRKALKLAGMTLKDINMIELNEAFAAQAIGCMRCTGARQMVTGMNHMKRSGYNTGLITMCIGGGMGMAMIIER